MNHLPKILRAEIKKAQQQANDGYHSLVQAFNRLALMPSPGDGEAEIAALCDQAVHPVWGHAAAIYVPVEYLDDAVSRISLSGKPVETVALVNWPDGKGSPGDTAKTARQAIAHGANGIAVIMDHKNFLKRDYAPVTDVLEICRDTCEKKIPVEVIIETSKYKDYSRLHDACHMALASTVARSLHSGIQQSPATPEAAAAIYEALNTYFGYEAGATIYSGTPMNTPDAAVHLALAKNMLGEKNLDSGKFRIGAPGLRDRLTRELQEIMWTGRSPWSERHPPLNP